MRCAKQRRRSLRNGWMGLQLSDETLPLRAVAVHPAVNGCSGERCTDRRRLAQMPTENLCNIHLHMQTAN